MTVKIFLNKKQHNVKLFVFPSLTRIIDYYFSISDKEFKKKKEKKNKQQQEPKKTTKTPGAHT